MRDPYHLGFSYNFDYKRLTNKMKIIDGDIYYNETVANDIFDMYNTRYKFHRDIYNHKAVKSIELMIGDILIGSDCVYNYSNIIGTDEFIGLDDSILTRIKYNNESCLDKCRMLINRIENRDIYKLVYSTNSEELDSIKDTILDKNKDNRADDYHFIEISYDFCNGVDSPLSKVNFYRGCDNKIDYENVNGIKLMPNSFKETIRYVYKK